MIISFNKIKNKCYDIIGWFIIILLIIISFNYANYIELNNIEINRDIFL